MTKPGDCYLTKGCEGRMVHALLGSFCNRCGIELDFHGDVVPQPYRPGFLQWSQRLTAKEAYIKATKAEVKKMAMKAKTVKVTLELPALVEGWEYTGEMRPTQPGDYFTDTWQGDKPGCAIFEHGECDPDEPMFIVQQVKWLAKPGCRYYYLREDFIVSRCSEDNNHWDRARWNANNYFQEEIDAEKLAVAFRLCLKDKEQ